MSGNLLVRFDEGRVGRTLCRPLSYSTHDIVAGNSEIYGGTAKDHRRN